jgi:hypothetical protein
MTINIRPVGRQFSRFLVSSDQEILLFHPEDCFLCCTKQSFYESFSFHEIHFSIPSHLREIAGFRCYKSLHPIDISAFVEIISTDTFYQCSSLNEIHFSILNHLRETAGFRWCKSLHRIDIPASVEIISPNAFRLCVSLNEIHISTSNHLREIAGLNCCTLLRMIEFPVSVEIIQGLNSCKSLQEVIIPEGSRVRAIWGFKRTTLKYLMILLLVTSMTFKGTTFLIYYGHKQPKHLLKSFLLDFRLIGVCHNQKVDNDADVKLWVRSMVLFPDILRRISSETSRFRLKYVHDESIWKNIIITLWYYCLSFSCWGSIVSNRDWEWRSTLDR